jgi:hypothetical protein
MLIAKYARVRGDAQLTEVLRAIGCLPLLEGAMLSGRATAAPAGAKL